MAKEKVKAKTLPETAPSWLKGWRPFALLALVVFALYARTLSFGYTNLDDTLLIRDNKAALEKGSLADAFSQNVFSMLPNSDDTYYRPLLTVSFIAEYKIAGESLPAFHFFNILFHFIACCLLFLLLTLLGYARKQSFIFTLLFAVHPVFSQAVSWIPGRNDSLLAIYVLASFVFLVKWLAEKKRSHLLLHFLFFLLALFTKETTLFVAPLFLLFSWQQKRRKNERSFKPVILLLSGWLLLSLVYLFARHEALASKPPVPAGAIISQVAQSSPELIPYAGKLLLPFNLSVFPVGADIEYSWGVLSLLLIAGVFFFARGKKTALFYFGLFWLLFLLLPALISKNVNNEQIFLEHRLYLPALGLVIVLMELAKLFNEKKPMRNSWLVPGAAIAFFMVINFIHTGDFADEESFWTSAVKTSPHSAYAWAGLGKYHHDKDQVEQAMNEYNRALELNPGAVDVCNNLGNIYLKKGMNENARQILRQGFAVRPTDKLCDNLGEALFALDSLDAAEQMFKKAIELNPEYTDAMNDLAAVYGRKGNFDAAVVLWKRVAELAPEKSAASINLVKVLSMQKNYEEAELYRQRLIQQGVEVPPLQRDSVK